MSRETAVSGNLILFYFKRIMSQLSARQRRYFWWLLAAMICLAGVETLAAAVIAFFASSISDPESVLESRYYLMACDLWGRNLHLTSRELILGASFGALLLVFLKNCVRAVTAYVSTGYALTIETVIGQKLLGSVMRMPHEWHVNQNPADLVLAMQWRVYFGRVFSLSFLNALSDTILVVAMLSVLMVAQPFVFLGVLGLTGSVAWLIFRQTRRVLDVNAVKSRSYSESLNRIASRQLYGVKDMIVFGRIHQGQVEFKRELLRIGRIAAIQNVLISVPVWVLETIGFVVLAAVVWVFLVVMGTSPARLTGGVALLAVTAWRVLPAVSRILAALTKFRNAFPFLEKGFAYLDQAETEGADAADMRPASALTFGRDIRFDDVSLCYKGAAASSLDHVSLTIAKGETLGVVGASGGGKSTFVDLLIGLLPPTGGQVVVDGEPLSASSRFAWMQSVGYVPQTPYIFDGSLAENVAFSIGGKDVDREKVTACCAMAAMDFLDKLPEGIDTRLGDRGAKLSGGQAQRVAIARALYNDPAVLVFDEATSALDAKSENAVQKTIYDVRGGRTSIIVAHRLNTVERCDRIVWIDNGRIRMSGPPEEVLPVYSETAMANADEEVAD